LNTDPPNVYLGELSAVASFAVLVKLSVTDRYIVPALAALDDVTIARRTTESRLLPKLTKLCVNTAVADSPKVIESAAASIVNVCDVTAAVDGATESIPKPKAAIAVIAIRLKNVFVDIDFLSLVVSETFPLTAGKE
jgi:hypothetical protein